MRLYENAQAEEQRLSVRRHTSERDRQAGCSVEPRNRGTKQKAESEKHCAFQCGYNRRCTGGGGWKLAATLRGLHLTGITKALEVVKQRSDWLRSVFNTVTSHHVKIYTAGQGEVWRAFEGPC